jgi:hypothetical protein
MDEGNMDTKFHKDKNCVLIFIVLDLPPLVQNLPYVSAPCGRTSGTSAIPPLVGHILPPKLLKTSAPIGKLKFVTDAPPSEVFGCKF